MLALFGGNEKCFAEEKVKAEQTSKIYILSMGDIEQSEMRWLCSELQREFGMPCACRDGGPVPAGAYNKDRRQYHATTILNRAHAMMPPDAARVLAVVNVDLYAPELNFVFGQASPGLKTTVISTYRLHQSIYGLKEDQELFRRRLLTEAVHELGHTFKLGHCENPHCVMYFSNTLADTDRKGSHFCEQCRRKLKFCSGCRTNR